MAQQNPGTVTTQPVPASGPVGIQQRDAGDFFRGMGLDQDVQVLDEVPRQEGGDGSGDRGEGQEQVLETETDQGQEFEQTPVTRQGQEQQQDQRQQQQKQAPRKTAEQLEREMAANKSAYDRDLAGLRNQFKGIQDQLGTLVEQKAKANLEAAMKEIFTGDPNQIITEGQLQKLLNLQGEAAKAAAPKQEQTQQGGMLRPEAVESIRQKFPHVQNEADAVNAIKTDLALVRGNSDAVEVDKWAAENLMGDIQFTGKWLASERYAYAKEAMNKAKTGQRGTNGTQRVPSVTEEGAGGGTGIRPAGGVRSLPPESGIEAAFLAFGEKIGIPVQIRGRQQQRR